MSNTFKEFLKLIVGQKKRRVLVMVLMISFWMIPFRISYPMPYVVAKDPLVREIDVQIPEPEIYPLFTGLTKAPGFTARSVIAVDVDSKAVIYMKNPNERLYPASTTKMVTALVAMDTYDLEKTVTINEPQRIGQVMELYDEENIKMEYLMQGLLIHSANDSAEALARMYPDGRSAFIAKMNEKVKSFGLTDTNFANPTGFDQYNHYSTVHDLAIIGTEVLKNPTLAKIVGTKYLVVTDETGEFEHELESTNQLLGNVEGMSGIKTGWTEYAGECLVTHVERDGRRIVTAVLGSGDRFGETEMLIDWVYGNHTWTQIE